MDNRLALVDLAGNEAYRALIEKYKVEIAFLTQMLSHAEMRSKERVAKVERLKALEEFTGYVEKHLTKLDADGVLKASK